MGTGSVALIEGEAGIGKTRLLVEVLGKAGELSLKRAGSRELEQGRPFGVLLDAFSLRRQADIFAKIERASELDSEPRHLFQAVDAVADSIEKAAITAPLVIALEDLHWVDEPSTLVIDRIVRMSTELPICVILDYRPSPVPPGMNVVIDSALRIGATSIRLQPLSPEESIQLTRDLVGGTPGPRLKRTIAGASGNPLFLTELIGALLDERSVVATDDVFDTLSEVTPPSLRMTILRRFSSLPSASLDALRVGAALGASFGLHDLALAMGTSTEETHQRISPAIKAGLLSDEGSRFTFQHDLVRDAIYEDSPEPVRMELHRRLASLLSDAGAPIAQVAEQAARAAQPEDEEVIGWLLQAGESLSATSPDLAIRYLELALEMAGGANAQISASLVRPLMWTARLEEAESHARRALNVTSETLDRARLLMDLGWVLYMKDEYHDGLETMRAATRTDGLPDLDRARMTARMALMANEYSVDLEEDVLSALDVAARSADVTTEATALYALSKLARGRDDIPAAHTYAEQANVRVAASEDPETRLWGPLIHGMTLFHLDRFDELETMLEAAMRAADLSGNRSHVPSYLGLQGALAFVRGRWDDAETIFAGSLDAAAQGDVRADLSSVAGHLAVLRFRRGDLPNATDLLERWKPLAVVQDTEPQVRWARALIAEGSGHLEEAAEHVAVACDFYQEAWGGGATIFGGDLVRIAMATGQVETAAAMTERLEVIAARSPIPAAEAAVARSRALLGSDADLATQAVDLYARTPRRLPLADALFDAGRLSIETGRKDEGIVHLRKAADLYGEFGAVTDINRTNALLRSVGVRGGATGRRNRPETGWESLTPSELGVAKLVAEGLTNKEISDRLFVSRKTVETHLSRAFMKLQVRSRVEVAKAAMEHEPPSDR
jgi:DNA-binding CsgD family transcriptional regulator